MACSFLLDFQLPVKVWDNEVKRGLEADDGTDSGRKKRAEERSTKGEDKEAGGRLSRSFRDVNSFPTLQQAQRRRMPS